MYNSWKFESDFLRQYEAWGFLRCCNIEDSTVRSYIDSWFSHGTHHEACGNDIGKWNMTKITSMDHLFCGANVDTCVDTASSTDSRGWAGCYWYHDFPGDCGRFDDVSFSASVMCCGCGGGEDSLECSNDIHNFNEDISKWDTSSVTSMVSLFENFENFNSDLSQWCVEKTTDMSRLFAGASSFNSDLSHWNIDAVTRANNMFEDSAALDECNRAHIFEAWNRSLSVSNFSDQYSEWNLLPLCNGSFADVLDQVYGSTSCGYNTDNCSCASIDTVMTTRYCVNTSCGTIPDAIFECNLLTSLELDNKSFHGTLPSKLGSLTMLRELNISNNAFHGTLPSTIGSLFNLESLDISTNHFSGELPTSIGTLTSLQELYLDRNMFNGTVQNHFEELSLLRDLYLSHNNFKGAIPVLRHHSLLKNIILHDNYFDTVQTGSLDGTDSLKNLSLTSQDVDELVLQKGAFRNMNSHANIFLAGNTILTVPSSAFAGRVNATIDLRNLGITAIHSLAFDNTSNVSILLKDNYVQEIAPNAFPTGSVLGSDCEDFPGWSNVCSNLMEYLQCDQTCSVSPFTYIGTDSMRAIDACCDLHGGYEYGRSVVMDEHSPIVCNVATSASNEVNSFLLDNTNDLNKTQLKYKRETNNKYVILPHHLRDQDKGIFDKKIMRLIEVKSNIASTLKIFGTQR